MFLSFLSSLLLLAEAEGEAVAPQGGGGPLGGLAMPLVAMGLVWYFLLMRPQRRDQQKREEMLGNLKKNDRVVTIGGMIATVAAVSDDKKEVTLKVDDNTRIKFQRSAIQTVLRDEVSEPANPAAAS